MTDSYFISNGPHPTRSEGMCAMEWVAFLAGEQHTDRPVCVSYVLQRFCIAFNDMLPDDQRQKLRPYLARTIGTYGDRLDAQRSWMAADWLIRVYTPAWLSLKQDDESQAAVKGLRSLRPIQNHEDLRRAMLGLKPRPAVSYIKQGGATWNSGTPARSAWESAPFMLRFGGGLWSVVSRIAMHAAPGTNNVWYPAHVSPDVAVTEEKLRHSLFELLDRMLPTEPIRLPVNSVEDFKQFRRPQPRKPALASP